MDVGLRSILIDAYLDENNRIEAVWQQGLIRVINKEVSSENLIKEFKSIKPEQYRQLAKVDSPYMDRFFEWWCEFRKKKCKAFKGEVKKGYLYKSKNRNLPLYLLFTYETWDPCVYFSEKEENVEPFTNLKDTPWCFNYGGGTFYVQSVIGNKGVFRFVPKYKTWFESQNDIKEMSLNKQGVIGKN